MPPSSMATFLQIHSYTHSPDCCTENLCEWLQSNVSSMCFTITFQYGTAKLNVFHSSQTISTVYIRRWWWCYWNYKENWNAAMWSLTLSTKLNCSLQCLAEASEMYNTDSTTWQESVHFSNLIFLHNIFIMCKKLTC